MLIKTLPVGHLDTNCYIVTDETSGKCAVVDPGDESNTILDYLEDNKLTCEAVFLTHGHYDHVCAVNALCEETGASVYINKKDYPDVATPYFPLRMGEEGRFYAEGDTVTVGALEFHVYETPGHTPGGVTLVCEDAMFSGDTLFKGSCGRCDLPGGDEMQILRSLRKLCSLPGDYEVYPGHMEQSTLEKERMFNYYCRAAMSIK